MKSAYICTPPDHGLETAAAECCRPSSPHFKGRRSARMELKQFAFWFDLPVWRSAARNTLNCLIGCSIGDIGVMIYMQVYHPHVSIWLTMGLAMIAGLITSISFESVVLRLRERFPWKSAFTMAFSMSFLSMLGMEAAANLTHYLLTGGNVAAHNAFYWTALFISLLAGFLVPLPYNYWKFKRHGQPCH